MSYGLYDGDWFTYGKSPFNLELMKLATYYRQHKKLTGMTLEFNPDLYTTLVYRKDYQDGIFEKNLSKYNNVECGGLAFTAGLYSPMDMDKELTPPDPTIYERFISSAALSEQEKSDFNKLMRACHFRLSLDNKTVWKDYMKATRPTKRTFIYYAHDPNLGEIEGAVDAIIGLMESTGSKINKYFGNKFPIVLYDFDSLKDWLRIPLSTFCTIKYNGFLTPEQIVELSQYPQSQLDRIQYNVAYGCTSTQDFVDNRLQQAFRSVAYLRKYRRKILLLYDTQYIVEKDWILLFKLLNGYAGVSRHIKNFDIVIKYDSFYSFVKNIMKPRKHSGDYGTPDEIRKLFILIANLNYNVFDDFYSCHTVHYENGRFEKDETN